MEKTWSRAVWLEGDQEEEGVIPTCWVKNKSVMWPSGTNVLKAMREMKLPEEHWIKFDLVKIKFTSGKKSECEKYSLTTTAEFSSSEEDEVVPRQRKKKRYDDYVTGFDKEQNNLENNGSANQDASKSLNKRSTPSISGKSRQCVETSAESDDEETSRRRLPSPPPVRKSPRKPQGREQSQIPLPPKKRAKTNELSAAVSRPSQIYEDLSSDEEENETESIPRRSPRKHKDSRPKDSSPTQRNFSPTQRRRVTALPPLESDDSERPVDMRSPSTPTASGYPMPTERFQRRVIQLLVEIRDNLRKGDHGRRVEEEQGEFEVPECDQIPEFEEFDNSLDDRELQKKMVLFKMLPLKMITTIAFKLLHQILICC